jgi:glycosyltransferase involved in cell wall biosynthesis
MMVPDTIPATAPDVPLIGTCEVPQPVCVRERKPLRVCHLAYTFYENDNRVIRYAEALAERGDEVDVVALRRPGQERREASGRLRVFRIQRRSISERHPAAYLMKLVWFLAKSAAFVTALHRRRPYDVVHVHNVPDFLVFAALAPRLWGARVILDIHDVLPELYAGKFGAAAGSAVFRALVSVERMSCRFADHVIVANHLWHATLSGRSASASRCTPILNYPDLRLFTHSPRREQRREGTFIILYPGTLNHHQGVDLAVRAFALAKDRMPQAELHIYGEGPARVLLEQLARAPELRGRVKVRDRVPLSRVPELMASADLGVVPKRADGFGNEAFSTKILEFMASGVPVIVSKTKVDAHYFDESVVRFFTPGDATDLAAAMIADYEHRSEATGRANRARTFAMAFSWQAHAADYLRIVDRLSGGPRELSTVV